MALDVVKTKTVEDLNPRSQAVKAMEMTVKRCLLLGTVMHEIFARCNADIDMVKASPPAGWGYLSFEHSDERGTMHTALTTLWGDDFWSHPEYQQWELMVDYWRSGSLDHQIRDLAANLPRSVRKKLDV